MAQRLPKTDAELLEISGVGDSKLARYGFEFLNQLRQFE
jgi:ATP-dependent DNA helicase RecQ